MLLSEIKTLVEIVQALVTILAICIGGWWAYRKFYVKREVDAKAQITQELMGK